MALHGSILLAAFGIWAIMSSDNLIKKVIALNIINSSVVLFFISIGHRPGGTAPIMQPGIENVVDPLPQALMLTAIVINLCMTALALVLILRLHATGKTLSLTELERQQEE